MPYLTPDAPTGNVFVRMEVPNTLLPSVVGAIASLWNPFHWEEYGALSVEDTLQLVGQVIYSLNEEVYPGNCPCKVFVPVQMWSDYLTTPSRSIQPLSVWGMDVYSGNFNPNWLEWSVILTPGTYRVDTWSKRSTNQGITVVTVDGTEIETFDGYSSPSTWDNYRQSDTIALEGEVAHTVRFTSTSRNASSSGYFQSVSHMELVRVG